MELKVDEVAIEKIESICDLRGLHGLVGQKIGMTRFYTPDGVSVPVSVIYVGINRITQIKSYAKDGYSAIQVAFGSRRLINLTKPVCGHLAKAAVASAASLHEFRVKTDTLTQFKIGDNLDVKSFFVGQKVDVRGITIGKGYAGTIKRHNFSSGRQTHGNSKSHNVPGSIGMAQDPGRVFPGKRMTGRLGGVLCAMQNLEVARLDVARGLLLIKGGIPGAEGTKIIITPAIKHVLTKKGLSNANSAPK